MFVPKGNIKCGGIKNICGGGERKEEEQRRHGARVQAARYRPETIVGVTVLLVTP